MDSAKPHYRSERERLWEAVTVLGFLALCGFNILHHAMWRDEMQPWVFARDSASIPELFRNMRYETHPRLWYLILFGITRLTSNPAAMQAANFLIIGLAVAIFVRYCPLPLYLKALTVFSYIFLFEWGTKSRSYALGVLFCFMFCARFPRRDKGYLELAVLLFLATQSNLCSGTVAAGLASLLVFEAWMSPGTRARIRARKVDATASVLLVVTGGLLALWTAIPQRDAGGPAAEYFKASVSFGDKILAALGAIFDGFVPLATQFLVSSPALHAGLGLALLLATVASFRRSRLILRTYVLGASLLFLFACINVENHWWQEGHFLLWFLICLWLAHYFPDSSISTNATPIQISSIQKLFFYPVLLLQLFTAAWFSIDECYRPFSCGKAVALYLEQHQLQDSPILGYPDLAAMPVSGYLDRQIYYPDTHRWGSFIIESNKRQLNWSGDEILQAIDGFAKQENRDFLVLLHVPLIMARDNQAYRVIQMGNLQEVASFHPAMIKDETYWLYHYKTGSPAPLLLAPFSEP